MTSEIHKVLARAIEALQQRGVEPVVVGGVALLLHGSDRATQDADILVKRTTTWSQVIAALYECGFCLVTRLNPDGSVRRFIQEESIALLKVREEIPDSLFFWNSDEKLRLDVLVDFPVEAVPVHARAQSRLLGGTTVLVASREDLKVMKEKALADRQNPKDATDFFFLGGTEAELQEIRSRSKRGK